MDIWNFLKPSSANFQTFENYFSGQPEITGLATDFNWVQNGKCQAIISGSPGSGVTHLLHAISNKWIEAGKMVLFTTGQSIIYILKKIESEEGRGRFKKYLLAYDMLAIDNFQFFYKKSFPLSNFISALVDECQKARKPFFIGCSNPSKDITRSKKYSKLFPLTRINLRNSSSQNVFRILKNLCEHEENIPEQLLYLISGYNGSMQEYINCLVSIRFKSKAEGIDLRSLSVEELEQIFTIKNYFPRQQLRKGFISELPLLWMENPKTNLQYSNSVLLG